MSITSDWRELDAASRERAYSPSSCIGGNYQPFIAAYAERSAAARARLRSWQELSYGSAPSQRLDLFLPAGAAPRAAQGAATLATQSNPSCAVPHPLPALLVFIHGGYWQELSKRESSFAASDAVEHGLAFAALDYTLAPQASVAEMVQECRQALRWLHQNAARLGFDAQRIVVAGSSAGAHLAAMCALPQADAAAGAAPGQPVQATVLVSGIYELEPLLGTSINTALGLTTESSRAISPALLPLAGFPPSVVCWGEIETDEFKRQSRDFAAALQRSGTPCDVFQVPQRNHFDIILDLADPATLLGRAVAGLVSSI